MGQPLGLDDMDEVAANIREAVSLFGSRENRFHYSTYFALFITHLPKADLFTFWFPWLVCLSKGMQRSKRFTFLPDPLGN